MKFIAVFPYSNCGICQKAFYEIDNNVPPNLIVPPPLAKVIIIPSMIKTTFLEDLSAMINLLTFPRTIIALGDYHNDLGTNIAYTPDYFSVSLTIQGCPPKYKEILKYFD